MRKIVFPYEILVITFSSQLTYRKTEGKNSLRVFQFSFLLCSLLVKE